jgi:hypothetical protein
MKNDVYQLMNLPFLSLMDNGGGVGWLMTDSPVSASQWSLERLSGESFLKELPSLQISSLRIQDKRN